MTIKPIIKAPKHDPKTINSDVADSGGPSGSGNSTNNSNNNGGTGSGGVGSATGVNGVVVVGPNGTRNSGGASNKANLVDIVGGGGGGGVGAGMSPRHDGIGGGGGGGGVAAHLHRRRRHNSPHKRHKRGAAVGTASLDGGAHKNAKNSAANYQIVLDHHTVPAAMSPRHGSGGGGAAGSNVSGAGGANNAVGHLLATVTSPSNNSCAGGVVGGGGGTAAPSADSLNVSGAAHCSNSGNGIVAGCSSSSSNGGGNNTGGSLDDSTYSGYNSGDEHIGPKDGAGATLAEWQDRDQRFVKAMQEACGFAVNEIAEDGACLFRSISLQLYGDQDMHEVIRQQTMDYIYKNREYFAQFVTEDIGSYVLRKRNNHVHGNHIEIQAISEIYNRPVELYCYQTEPINIFNSDQLKNGYEPLRLSYQRGSHYNAILNPYKASVGVGLGLAGYSPTRPDRVQLRDAVRLSENLEIEQTMFEDKLKTTDWEATNVAIEEQIARESYMQWCQERMQSQRDRMAAASGSSVPPTVDAMAAAGLDGGKSAKGSDDDSVEDGSSFGSDSELKLEQNTLPAYSGSHYTQQQRTGGGDRRRKRRRCTATATGLNTATANAPMLATPPATAGPSTRSGSTTTTTTASSKQARLESGAIAVNATLTEDLPGTSRQAVASTSSGGSTGTGAVSSFYHELLESSYADDFAGAGGRQLSEEQMLQKALQMSRMDFVQKQLVGRQAADSDPPSP